MRASKSKKTAATRPTQNEFVESVEALAEVALSTAGLCGDLTCGDFLDTSEIQYDNGDSGVGELTVDPPVGMKKDTKRRGLRFPKAFQKNTRPDSNRRQQRQSAYHVMNRRGYLDVVGEEDLSKIDRSDAIQSRHYFMDGDGKDDYSNGATPNSLRARSAAPNRNSFWPRHSTSSRRSSKGRKNDNGGTSDSSTSTGSLGSQNSFTGKGTRKSRTRVRKLLKEDDTRASSFDRVEHREDNRSPIDRYAVLSEDEKDRIL
ncbi:hypothetical protein IV203_010821 [Nitzschia inconspicua]|uniref:Uncharacterized protein n=1 Tax=Nitzschia inconspicua TaxID=303405 RepID=A0A9K3PLT0_9STRA|nr:hypothetical protein IV203_010821 [Nitzschia inconspicua]